jgi:hypothetical protein
MEITSVLLEGGALVNGVALASGEVDKVFLYYAPKILGGGAVPFIAGGRPARETTVRATFRIAALRGRLRAGRLFARPVLAPPRIESRGGGLNEQHLCGTFFVGAFSQ